MTAPGERRAYLDWLRGVAVLVMVEAHTLDSWTRLDDRDRLGYQYAMVVAGFGAPIFLFLAGVALVLALASRMRRGRTAREAVSRAWRRGWQIFGLAFLFRLQSWVISGGPLTALLKVDILNVLGLSMLAGTALWRLGPGSRSRAALLAGGAALIAMITPVVRSTELLAGLPDPVEWYLRPSPGRTTFTLFPWAGFLLAGAATGLWLDTAQTVARERVANLWLAAVGVAMALGGYAASLLPPLYEHTSFWTSSPTFFFLRLGVVTLLVPLAYAWGLLPGRSSPLRLLGISSLFVYWVHVELVYGVLSMPLHRRLTFEQALLGLVVFSAALYGLVRLKTRLVRRWEGRRSARKSLPGNDMQVSGGEGPARTSEKA